MLPVRRTALALVIVLLARLDASGQTTLLYTGQVAWEPQSGVLKFTSSGRMPDSKEGFYWSVPPYVKKIVVGANVTVTGAFRVGYRDPQNPLVIAGDERRTSIIYGTDSTEWPLRNNIPDEQKWKYGAVCVLENATVYVTSLTSKNPRAYHITGCAERSVIHVSQCNLLDTRGGPRNNSDGFGAAAGSSIRDSFISTCDDGIKIYHDMTIERVTIEQRPNGAPIQLGWANDSSIATATIRDLTIRGVAPQHRYNMAPISWARGSLGIRNLRIKGLQVTLDGSLRVDDQDRWIQQGLFKLLPPGCTLNLVAEDAVIDPPVLGIKRTQGNVTILRAEAAR